MINPTLLILLFIGLAFWSCDDNQPENIPETNSIHFGTYLYEDEDCSGSDIQYATFDSEGITFFDYLGDNCDDTVGCYAVNTYELSEITQDSFLIVPESGSVIVDGTINIDGDSLMTLSYTTDKGTNEYMWEKFSDDVYSFTPACDQEYAYTKDIADMLVYAVSNDGSLLWKRYIHGGIWDLASAVTPLSDGGYMVYGIFDGIEWGGCCYNLKWDVGDIVKLNGEGQIEWRKEIDFADDGMSSWYNYIGKSLIETSNGDLVFIAPINGGGINIVMMDAGGNLIWSQNYPDLGFWNYNAEIMETDDGDLAVMAGYTAKLTLLDYYSGSILKEAEYVGLKYPRAIVNVLGDFAIIGNAPEGDDDYSPVYLLKVSSDGDEIWRKIWSEDSNRPRTALDLIHTADNGFLLFCYSDPHPYATLIKTDSEGNELWRKKYDDYVGGSQGWIHQTEDGGFFMASGYAVTKLDQNCNVIWNAAAASGFDKYFSNGMVSGINHSMKPIENGAVMAGYGSSDWE